MDASGFWDMMDTSLVPRDEIELLARFFADSMRKSGFRNIADKFVSEAKLEHVEEQEGSFGDYLKLGMRHGANGMDMYTFFCHERLKYLKRIKEATCQGTQTQSSDQADVVYSDAKKAEFRKLCKYVMDYFNKNIHLADVFVNAQKTVKAQVQVSDGSGKRKSSGEEADGEGVKEMDCCGV